MTTSLIALVMAIVITAFSQLLLKFHYRQKQLWILALSSVLFASIPVCSYVALKHLSLSQVYLSTAVTQVLVLVLARFFLHETFTPAKKTGAAFILLGIVVFAWG